MSVSPSFDPYHQILRASASMVLQKLLTTILQSFSDTSASSAKSPGTASALSSSTQAAFKVVFGNLVIVEGQS